ncbi:MAG: L,D-transpeptidase [Microbacterium sp.]|uniref:L,D-transpeptidase family protein n=1 Tax=Microbacterium sp. TaxID=51671 RepID=UPI0039E2742F
MTDSATPPAKNKAETGSLSTDGDTVYQWAPASSAKRRRRAGLWASGIAVIAVIGVVAASLVLIAPGTAIAGVQVGGLTAGAAAEAVSDKLLETQVVLAGEGGGATVTGADLGAHVDAKALADAVFAERPMWNPTAWFNGASDAEVTIDPDAAAAALRKAAPSLYRDPVDATIAYDKTAHKYTFTADEPGTGIDVDAVAEALHTAFAEGKPTIELDVSQVPVEAKTTTAMAKETTATLNTMLSKAGFYVGKERTVKITHDTLASWLTVSADETGNLQVTADVAAIQTVVDKLAKKVNRKVVNTTVIADSDGKVLNTIRKGTSGRKLDSTAGVADAFAAQLANGNSVYKLPVTVTKPTVKKIERSIEVDLSSQRMFLRQNGKVIGTYAVSTGKPGTPTHTGTFAIGWKLTSQDMGNEDTDKPPYYYTENVPWVMYFNGDQALHGAYWHNNFGHVMSHGCVNLPVNVAKMVFNWAPVGTPVWIHY